jgi:hypothetical protein
MKIPDLGKEQSVTVEDCRRNFSDQGVKSEDDSDNYSLPCQFHLTVTTTTVIH